MDSANLSLGFFLLVAIIGFVVVASRFDRFMKYVEAKEEAKELDPFLIDSLEDRVDRVEDGLKYHSVRLNEQTEINQILLRDLLKAQGRIEELDVELQALRTGVARASLQAKQEAE